MSGMHLSKEFFELIKAIGESKSKQEEDRIIASEILTLKKKLDGSSGGGGGLMMSPGSPIPSMGTPGGKGGKREKRQHILDHYTTCTRRDADLFPCPLRRPLVVRIQQQASRYIVELSHDFNHSTTTE